VKHRNIGILISENVNLAVVYAKRTHLRGILIASLVIFYNGAKLVDLLTVSVKLVKNFVVNLYRTVQ